MRRSTRFLTIALPVALATVPVALAGADPASGGPEQATPSSSTSAAARAAGPVSATRSSSKTRAAAAAALAKAVAKATMTPPTLIVRVKPGATVALRSRPNGRVALRAGDTSQFGSAQRLGVVRRHGRWLGVTTPALPSGALGWVDRRSAAVRVERTRWAIHADISSRTVVLRRAGKPVKRLRVAVGRPGSPTPTGRFAVTDKLSGGDYGPYYGCCILAISATQPNTPPGWTGGNRMAIHGTSDPSSIGAAASAGCLRAADGDLSFLMSRVPVGAPVVIRR
ncbi:MAG TPA: L,D-transpeptidase [Thermoleophilaceae bacterium]|nr:L,D-transpeptidase [Thermoleophilaceae bacterium]